MTENIKILNFYTLYPRVGLGFVQDVHVAWMEIHKRAQNSLMCFLIFYDHSPPHYDTYQSLEAEMEKVLYKVYIENAYGMMGIATGIYFFDLTRCDEFKQCRELQKESRWFGVFTLSCEKYQDSKHILHEITSKSDTRIRC